MARPRSTDPLSEQFSMRLTVAEKERFAVAARASGQTLPELMRACTSLVLDMNEARRAEREYANA